MFSPLDALVTANPTAQIFLPGGGFTMFLPPTANPKPARKVKLSSLEQRHTGQGDPETSQREVVFIEVGMDNFS